VNRRIYRRRGGKGGGPEPATWITHLDSLSTMERVKLTGEKDDLTSTLALYADKPLRKG